jgi:hypothetical protein
MLKKDIAELPIVPLEASRLELLSMILTVALRLFYVAFVSALTMAD